MNIAFLISAYKDPAQLKRLINALQGEGSHFYIHIDRKVDISFFLKVCPEFKANNQSLTYLKKRFPVYWGGFSQVRYQFAMLDAAINSNTKFDRIVIITGQDYPLIPRTQIIEEFSNNSKKEYIIGYNLSNTTEKTKQLELIQIYHFFTDFYPFSQKVVNVFSGISRRLMKILPIRKKTYFKINGQKWDIYKSSSYMAITGECGKYVHKQMQNKTIINYFKWSCIPEEFFIPTILFNSDFAQNAEIIKSEKYPGLQKLSAITYFEYDDIIKVFDENDIDELKKSKKIFSRKFASNKSEKLIKELQKQW